MLLDECVAARLSLVLNLATFETSTQFVPTPRRIQLFMPVSFYEDASYRDKKKSVNWVYNQSAVSRRPYDYDKTLIIIYYHCIIYYT